MAQIKIESNFGEVKAKLGLVAQRFPAQMEASLKNAGNLTIRDLRKKTPKQSGNLARGYVIEKKGRLEFEVTNNVKTRDGSHFVSDLLEDGTRAHGPVSAKVLAWKDLGRRPNRALGTRGRRGTGGTVFAKFVSGIKAMKIFERTVPEANNHVRNQMLSTLDRIAASI